MEHDKLMERYNDDIIRLRREFHRHPELSFEETETTRRIASVLDEWGIPYQINEEKHTGLVARISGAHPGKAVALRADIDALPVTEKTGLPFASEVPGRMHACGHDNHIAMGLVQLLLAGIVMVINQKFFISGFKSLWHRAPNMDTLVALGSMASFLWSVYVLFAMTRAQVDGDSAAIMNYMMEFYFESAAMILTLITVGKMLEARSKG